MKLNYTKHLKNQNCFQRMSKNIVIFFLTILFPIIGYTQDFNIYFNNANKLYAEGKYKEAAELYNAIIKNGVESGEVYFNLGNIYYKQDEIGKSILYYEKASRFLQGDESLEQNLKIVKLKIIDKIEPIPKLFLEEWWDTAIRIFPIDIYAWVNLALFIFTLVFISMNIIFNRRIFRNLIWIFSIFFAINFVLFLGKIYESETLQHAIILNDKISVVSEPNLSGLEIFILHEGTKVRINRILDDWFEISLDDGKTGWLKANSLEII